MPAYRYKALAPDGKITKGMMQGDSSRQIRQNLRAKDLLPVEVEADQQKNTADKPITQKKINAHDLALMTRQLAVLIAAAIPLEEALASVAKQTQKPHVKFVMLSVRSLVLEGHGLADALVRATNFPKLYVATVAAGEKSGHLDLILQQLADYTENRFALQNKIKGAMIYPIVLMVIAFAIVIGLMSFVVPKIVKVFEHSDQALPLITQVVLGMSSIITQFWWLLLGVIAVITVLTLNFVRTEVGRHSVDSLVLKLPILSRLTKSLNAARFASTLSILVRSGVPLIDALQISAEVITNVHISKTIHAAAVKVTEGASLSSQLEQSPYFPPMMIQMIKSGENSGELENMLGRAADMQESEATTLISTLLALLQPLMLVLMGVVVMIIVMAVMLPIVNMNDLAG